MSYEKTCERSTKYIKQINKEKMNSYCKRGKRVLDTLIQPQPTTTQSERFFSEEWINVCEKNQNGLPVSCDLYDNMKQEIKPKCYPSRKIDHNTGKIASELSDRELEKICGKKIIRSIDVPHDVLVTIEFGEELLKKGYQRVKYGYKEDFSIPEKDLSSETLFLWKSWMELNGPRGIRKTPKTNYYFNYVKWINSDITPNNKKEYSGAVEWLLKGGDLAYLWLQSDVVINKIAEKYKDY